MATTKFVLSEELKKVFQHFNECLFNNVLRVPEHVFQPDKKVVFQFQPNFGNIIVGLEMAGLSLPELLNYYLHQMVHIYNYHKEIIDCTSNQYHNKHFLKAAIGIGLFVSHYKNQGWSSTSLARPNAEFYSPSEESQKKLQEAIKALKIDELLWKTALKEVASIRKNRKPKQCFLKYVCECPSHNSIRSGRRPNGKFPLKARCDICGAAYKYVEE